MAHRDIAHGDRTIGRGPETAAGDHADDCAVAAADLRVSPHRRAALGLDAHQLARCALAELFLNGLCAGETALLAAAFGDGPNQSRLHRRRRFVDVVAIEAKPGLEP